MTPDQLMAREARVLQVRLEFGLASLEEVELWADAWVWSVDKPPDALSDVCSLARTWGPNIVYPAISRIGGEITPRDVVRALKDVDPQSLSFDQLARIITSLSQWAYVLIQYDADEAWPFLDLANGDFDLPSLQHPERVNAAKREAYCADMRDAISCIRDFARKQDAEETQRAGA